MCTTGCIIDKGILFKNRDKMTIQNTVEELYLDKKMIGCGTKGAGYFSLALNSNSVAFVTTAINPPDWGRLVYEGKIPEADELLKKEYAGRTRPATIINDIFIDAKSALELCKCVVDSTVSCPGYHFFAMDINEAYVIEVYDKQRAMRKLDNKAVITNHFANIKYGPQKRDDYASSYRRFDYADREIVDAESVDDVMNFLNPNDSAKADEIWRKGAFSTVSSSVIDLKEKSVYHCNGYVEKYRKYSL